MLRGYVINVSPAGVLTIWSEDQQHRFRCFLPNIPNITALRGIGVEFEPTLSGDLTTFRFDPEQWLSLPSGSPYDLYQSLASAVELLKTWGADYDSRENNSEVNSVQTGYPEVKFRTVKDILSRIDHIDNGRRQSP